MEVNKVKKRIQLILGLKDERGATAIIVGILMIVFISLAALAVDIGYAMVTRNQLQNIADGAALAGASELGGIYEGMNSVDVISYVPQNPGPIHTAAKNVGSMNSAGEVSSITINDTDIEIGRWVPIPTGGGVFTTSPGMIAPDAVKATVKRDGSANGPVTTFFANIFGRDTISITADAIAALTGPSEIDECELFMPVGIAAAWFEFMNEDRGTFCDQDIRFYPTGDMTGCAGWHTFDSWPSNASKLAQLLLDKAAGDCSDGQSVGDQIVFTGGTVASAFDEMKALWDFMKVCDDTPNCPDNWDLDTNPDTWTTHVVIYDLWDCSNPTGYLGILGFATVEINKILETPEKEIGATLKCLDYAEGHGGGGAYGTRGTIPSLVE